MTTRRNLLKIKVSTSSSPDMGRVSSLQGMSEAKVEKIKVAAYMRFITLNSIVTLLHSGSSAENRGNCIFSKENTWLTILQGSSFGTGIEVQDRRKRVLVISTGSKSVDAILGGM
ncbi:hypothetical protein BS17DRAFT_598272 [Gyrodon lividus]|nr:hypothetical protein BS17DRAFT_598272 [Gyrodon lividus]